ncbi:hypothetical protein F2Q69_00054493 [Brassica cretica]|uniref:Uncharacterized protein n=1 Tax=Brassica cretica TaxID=69181 RepID=A0A8S9N817_BRACR|nr:hypothetical protein F2Q69_00054493 [Brassica cretica]
MTDSRRERFSTLGRRSLKGLIQNQCGISCGMIAFSDVTEGKERRKPASGMAIRSLASLFVLAAVDPGLLFGQLLLFYPIEVFFFLGHGSFEGRVLPSGLASRSSWVDVSTVIRVIGLVAYIQVDAFDFFSFVPLDRRRKVLRSWLCTWLERFIRVWPGEALSACAARFPGAINVLQAGVRTHDLSHSNHKSVEITQILQSY